MQDPTDEQMLVMNLATEAWKCGPDHAWISRDDLLNGKTLPQHAGMKLLWAALTIPDDVLEWRNGGQEFRLRPKYAALTKGEEIGL